MSSYSFFLVLALAIATTTSQDPANTTTTAAPTTHEPSTTVAPTPTTPAPIPGKWQVEEDGKVCIMATMALQFNVAYKVDAKAEHFTWNFPNTSTVSGHCGAKNATNQVMMLDGDAAGNVTLTFTKTDKEAQLDEIKLNVNLNPKSKTPLMLELTATKQTLFKVNIGNSYLCKSNTTVKLSNPQNVTGHMMTTHLQVQAFMESSSTKDAKFGEAQECPADAETSNIVPIAVGAALAALVVVVLIAYLISRNRNKRGYESV